MRRAKTFRTLQRNRQKLRRTDLFRQPFAQSLSLDELHDEKHFSLLLDHVVDGGDVGMVEGRGTPAFVQKTFRFLGAAVVVARPFV